MGKDPDAGKDLRQEEKGMTEDEMVGWHQATGTGEPGGLPSMGSHRVRHDCSDLAAAAAAAVASLACYPTI